MHLFTLSLTEHLIGIPAQEHQAPWGRHQSQKMRTAVITVCGKTPSTKHSLLGTDSSAGAHGVDTMPGWEEGSSVVAALSE